MNNFYYHDIFYNIKGLDFVEVLNWALSKPEHKLHIEKLERFQREKDAETTYESFIEKRKTASFLHEVIIYRRGYDTRKKDETRWCLEISSNIITADKKDLFIFIYLPETYLNELITTFGLKEL